MHTRYASPFPTTVAADIAWRRLQDPGRARGVSHFPGHEWSGGFDRNSLAALHLLTFIERSDQIAFKLRQN